MDAFWERVEVGDDHWLWTGVRQPNGYGRLCVGGEKLLAHRLSYEMNVGPVPAGMYVLHACDTKLCVRPDHLELGTHAKNMRDAADRGLYRRGELHPRARLTEQDVLEIRRRAPTETRAALAAAFGVRANTVSAIVLGQTWRHVPVPA